MCMGTHVHVCVCVYVCTCVCMHMCVCILHSSADGQLQANVYSKISSVFFIRVVMKIFN